MPDLENICMGDRNEMEEAKLRQGCFVESFTDKLSLWHYCPGPSSSVPDYSLCLLVYVKGSEL